MKQLILVPILLLAACAGQSTKKAVVLRALPVGRPVSTDCLRTSDQLREYQLGRYVDARDALVMHEGHPVYRVETSAHWDLRPNDKSSVAHRNVIQSPAVSANDAVVAEVNKQRAATRAFTEQTATLNQRLNELSQAVAQTKQVAEENLALKRDVAALRNDLTTVTAQLRGKRSNQSSPSSSPADTW